MELLIGRLATDPDLRRRFAANPFAAIAEQELDLNAIEIAALAATDPAAFHMFATALDPRIRRAKSSKEILP